MSIQGNGRNHNQRPNFNSQQFSSNEPTTENNLSSQEVNNSNDFPVDLVFSTRKRGKNKKKKQDYHKMPSSAYDDLDDFIYKQEKSRRRRRKENKVVKEIKKMFGIDENAKKMKTWKKVVISIICVLLALIIGLVATVAILDNKGKSELLKNDKKIQVRVPDKIKTSEDGKIITTEDGKQYRYNENITSVLCMGVDKEVMEDVDVIGTGGAADALFLITIDTSTGTTNMINISRDTMAEIAVYSTSGSYIGTEEMQICLAYSYGDGKHTSCQNQVNAVSRLFYNIPINSYLSLDLEGIKAINDSVGGVTVVSPETIGPFVAGQTYTLLGDDTEAFVRERTHEVVEGNSLRMERQKVYLESFVKALVEQTKKDIQTPLKLYETATPYICSNLDASKITYLGLNAIRGQYGEFQVKSIEGEVKQGDVYAEFYLDEDKFFDLFLDIFYLPMN